MHRGWAAPALHPEFAERSFEAKHDREKQVKPWQQNLLVVGSRNQLISRGFAHSTPWGYGRNAPRLRLEKRHVRHNQRRADGANRRRRFHHFPAGASRQRPPPRDARPCGVAPGETAPTLQTRSP